MTNHAEPFYLLDADRFRATVNTRGPWDADHQHAGPPSALLTRALEAVDGGGNKQLVKINVEILGPLPIATFEVMTEVIKPGRRVDLVAADLRHNGRTIMTARAWRFQTHDVSLPAAARDEPSPRTRPPEQPSDVSHFFASDIGYHTAMEWRFASGDFLEPGDASTWMRMKVPLLPGEEPSPAQRVMCAADSASGVSARLDTRSYLFINTDLTVVLNRGPEGEWIRLDASTTLEEHGVGSCRSTICDEGGPLGHSLQSLYLSRR